MQNEYDIIVVGAGHAGSEAAAAAANLGSKVLLITNKAIFLIHLIEQGKKVLLFLVLVSVW